MCGAEREKVTHSMGPSQTLITDRTPIKMQILTQPTWVSTLPGDADEAPRMWQVHTCFLEQEKHSECALATLVLSGGGVN